MGTIFIKNLNKSVDIKDPTRTLLHNLQLAHIDWMHACGGKGRCTTCTARVLEGNENTDHYTAAEIRYLTNGALRPEERLACQVVIKGDVVIEVPGEYKLPHLSYTDG
jgi:2Fe-2S ferredoxin